MIKKIPFKLKKVNKGGTNMDEAKTYVAEYVEEEVSEEELNKIFNEEKQQEETEQPGETEVNIADKNPTITEKLMNLFNAVGDDEIRGEIEIVVNDDAGTLVFNFEAKPETVVIVDAMSITIRTVIEDAHIF